MRSYGQFCPIAKAAELFCERWTAIIIRNLYAGSSRFSDIHRGAPHMSRTLLSQRLKQLEAEGIVCRQRSETGNSWTYHLTEAGQEFVPLVALLGQWGQRWTRRDLRENELDLGLLIWGLEHCINPAAFGRKRHVIHLHVTDVPPHKADYWWVCETGTKEMCVSDPGYDIDLFLAASLRSLTHIYRGDTTAARAIAEDRLEAIGPSRLINKLQEWLNLGPMAEIPAMKAAPVGSR